MLNSSAIAKISVNFYVIFVIICCEIITTNSRTSTLWKLNSDGTKIIGENRNIKFPTDSSSLKNNLNHHDSLFYLITSAEKYGNTWIKQIPSANSTNQRFFHKRENQTKENNNFNVKLSSSYENVDNMDLSCGKPVDFTFYDNLVGVINRRKHPVIVDPEAVREFTKKFKFKIGKSFDLEMIEKRLKLIKKERPKSVATFKQLGNFWRMKGDARKAIECFRTALAVSPHNSEVLLNLAQVLLRLQYLDDAISLTRRSLEVAPPEKGIWQHYFTLGEIFKAYGHYRDAAVHFHRTLDLYPGYEPAKKLLKEIEEIPMGTHVWHTYTSIIIGTLVIVVLFSVSNLDRSNYDLIDDCKSSPHKHVISKKMKKL